jgi:hypothetical protein
MVYVYLILDVGLIFHLQIFYKLRIYQLKRLIHQNVINHKTHLYLIGV